MDVTKLNVDNDLFSGRLVDNIVVLSSKEKPLLLSTDLDEKKTILDYLDLVDRCDEVRVLLLKESPQKMNCEEYVKFYLNLCKEDADRTSMKRMNNAFEQTFLRLLSMRKVVIHVDRGHVIMRYMTIGFACDYRIIADDTVFQNPNLQLGIIPKGGISFMLPKMLGRVSACRILLSEKNISATEALELNLVDQVVPVKDLDDAAMKVAQTYAKLSPTYVAGIKTLLNNDINDLKTFHDKEDSVLRQPCDLNV
jgi:2-(1,2-epoxy-1,2-dihydrophenyl)acetyl-CoA isomerase